MKLSEKKNFYHRFLNKELSAAELEEFFLLMEQGEFDDDYLELMPDLKEELIITPIYKSRPAFKLFARIAIAASLLLISGISYLAYRRAEHTKLESAFTIVKVPVGAMKVITLTDHSVITLSSGAVFKYPSAFANSNRKVFLISGKGFFQIAKDKTRPFTVYTAQLSTTVLGTSFTIENYKAYHVEKIRLFTGSVKIGSKDKNFTAVQLSPGQQYSHTNLSGRKSIFASAGDIHPIAEDGTLNFENTSLIDALIQVASYYDTGIQFNKQDLKDYAISGKFSNEPVEDVLHTLLFTHHLKFKKIPEGYVIMK